MLDITRQTRSNFLRLIDGLSTEQLNLIPEGFNNNLIWNFAHNIVTQQLLTYGLAGLPTKVDNKWIAAFRKGTKPEQLYSAEEIEQLKALTFDPLDQFEDDYKAGIFETFRVYPTSYGVTLNTLEEAIAFNNVHEGLHLGYAMSMRKKV